MTAARINDVFSVRNEEDILKLGGEKCPPPFPCGSKETKKHGEPVFCRCGCGIKIPLECRLKIESLKHDEFLATAKKLEDILIFVAECTSMARMDWLLRNHVGKAEVYNLLEKAKINMPQMPQGLAQGVQNKIRIVTVDNRPNICYVRFCGLRQWHKIPIE